MSINLGVIDQRIRKIAEDFSEEFDSRFRIGSDENKKRSLAFVFLAVRLLLDLPDEEVLDCITEGGNDFGVDALHAGDVEDGEFVITLFQGKYKQKLEGDSNFPQSGVEKMLQAVRHLFDPDSPITANEHLKRRIEEVRSLVRDGHIPRVRAVLCNNGLRWNEVSQNLIDQSGFPDDQVGWEYLNHDSLVKLQQSVKPVTETLRLSGKAIVEDFEYSRVLLGKIQVGEIASLFDRQGDVLLERNVRRYLGQSGNRVNEAIARTLQDETERRNFFFYNNGITLLCSKFSYNALQSENFQVKVEGLQVINGGQTCKTIQQTLNRHDLFKEDFTKDLEKAFVLVRLYELSPEALELVRNITYNTNSQNPVDLRDLKSNDDRQRSLELAMRDLGFTYHPKRSETPFKPTDISSAVVAEAVLSVWLKRPHQAKFQAREHFGKLYDVIFHKNLNAAQAIVAVLIYRVAESRRRRVAASLPDFVAYGSCFLAMLMGGYLLEGMSISLDRLDHRNFTEAKALLEEKEDEFFSRSVDEIERALERLYGKRKVSLQRLAATFRRGDLIEELAAAR